jgi:hypothetical protein
MLSEELDFRLQALQFDNRIGLGYPEMSLASRVFYSWLPLSIVRVRPGVGPEVLIGI